MREAATDTLPKPPVVVRPSNELPAKLGASLDSVVNLKFLVVNPSQEPIKVEHPSGQKYDFVVIDSSTGRVAWRWSADKSFPAMRPRRAGAGGGHAHVRRALEAGLEGALPRARDAGEHEPPVRGVYDHRRALIVQDTANMLHGRGVQWASRPCASGY